MKKSKLIKKSIVSLLGLTSLSVPIILSSCSVSWAREEFTFITDGGSIFDESFNQQGYSAWVRGKLGEFKDFDKSFDDELVSKERLKYQNSVFNSKGSQSEFIQAQYRAAETSGYKYAFATGFYHETSANAYYSKNSDSKLKLINIDSGNSHPNMLRFIYDVKSSGFLAGVGTWDYLQNNDDDSEKTNNKGEKIVGTWGGAPFPAITDFIYGFLLGIAYKNALTTDDKQKVKLIHFNSPDDFQNTNFASGSDGVKRAEFLVKNGVDIILPVAGPQTEDAIRIIKENKVTKGVKIVGVDVDQSLAYSESKELFLTSIVKEIEKSLVRAAKVITSLENEKEVDWTLSSLDGFENQVKSFLGLEKDKIAPYGTVPYACMSTFKDQDGNEWNDQCINATVKNELTSVAKTNPTFKRIIENEANQKIYEDVKEKGLSSMNINGSEKNIIEDLATFIPNESIADSSFISKTFKNDYLDPSKPQNSYYAIIYNAFIKTGLYKGSDDSVKKTWKNVGGKNA